MKYLKLEIRATAWDMADDEMKPCGKPTQVSTSIAKNLYDDVKMDAFFQTLENAVDKMLGVIDENPAKFWGDL